MPRNERRHAGRRGEGMGGRHGRSGHGRGNRRRHLGQVAHDALTLDSVSAGDRVRVVRILGGRRLVHRLSTLGIVPGSLLTVNRSRGPALVSMGGARIAIGRQAATAVEVEQVAR